MQRILVGVVAIAMLAVAAAVFGWSWSTGETLSSGMSMTGASCFRLGLVFAAVWLAFHPVKKFFLMFPPWFLGACFVGLVIVVIRPHLIVGVIPILGLLWFFGPRMQTAERKKGAGRSKQSRSSKR